MAKPILWAITPWAMNGHGGWVTQPIILIEGDPAFLADHPSAYIAKLRAMHDDKTLAKGPIWTSVGQLKDALEQSWYVVGVNHAGLGENRG